MNNPHIVIVEDDDLLRTSLVNLFENSGYQVSPFESSEGVIEKIQEQSTNIIISDVILPDGSGHYLFNKLNNFPSLGKIFISNKINLEDRIKGLSCGADDYICKPLDSTELLLRTQALLKRIDQYNELGSKSSAVVHFHGLNLHLESRILSDDKDSIELGLYEHELLLMLIANQGKICERERICYILGNDNNFSEGRALDNLIKRLRKKLSYFDQQKKFIITFRNQGYMLSES